MSLYETNNKMTSWALQFCVTRHSVFEQFLLTIPYAFAFDRTSYYISATSAMIKD